MYVFLAMLHGMWDLSSPTWDGIQCPLSWKYGVLTTGLPGELLILSLFKKIFIFNWLMIALQYWFDFCHISTWINHRCSYNPSLWNLPPTRLLQSPSLSSLNHPANSHCLSIYMLVYMHPCYSLHSSQSLPHLPRPLFFSSPAPTPGT